MTFLQEGVKSYATADQDNEEHSLRRINTGWVKKSKLLYVGG